MILTTTRMSNSPANPEPIKGGNWEIPENARKIELHFSADWAKRNGINLSKPGNLENHIQDWIIDQNIEGVEGVNATCAVNSDGSFMVTVSATEGTLPVDDLGGLVEAGYQSGAEMVAF